MKHRLLVPRTLAAVAAELAGGRTDVEIETFWSETQEAFRARLAGVHGVGLGLTPFGAAEVAAAPALKVVARIGVGYDTVDVAALTKARVPLMIAGIANSVSVAEHALYFMLAHAKRGAELHATVVDGQWRHRLERMPSDLFGKTVLVVGCGRVGLRTLRRCVAFEMRVLAVDPYVSQDMLRVSGAEPVTDLDEALAQADYLTLHCPKTPETVGLIDARRLALMKPGACVINTARGGIVDDVALAAALAAGRLGGAGVDVFDPEPPAPDHPLLKAPNVITAPHMAGVSREAWDRMARATVTNLLDAVDGRPSRENTVNPEVL